MVSNRARVGRSLGTRLNGLDSRVASAEAKARTTDLDAADVTSRLAALEEENANLKSPNYRIEQDIAVRGSDQVVALLDPAYVGPGPASVRFNFAATTSEGPYEWKGQYLPWGNRVVNMTRIDGTWYIAGHSGQSMSLDTSTGYGGTVAIPLSANWRNYSDVSGTFQFASATAQKLSSGIVVLSGVIAGGTVTTGTVVGNLPVGMRPDTDQMFPIMNGSNWRGITVQANGDLIARTSWTNDQISLDGIAFPAAGVASWTIVGSAGSGSAYSNGWSGYTTSVFGEPAFWRDPYGLVWLRGLVAGGTQTENALIFSLPAASRSYLEQHHPINSSDGYGTLGALSTSGVMWKNGNFSNVWTSLGGVTLVTSTALSTGTWYTPPYFSSWTTHTAASFPNVRFTRRPDGLGLAVGMFRSGTIGGPTARYSTVPTVALPDMQMMQPRPSNSNVGRVDMYGYRMDASNVGATNVQAGSNSWVSIDGMKWMVG